MKREDLLSLYANQRKYILWLLKQKQATGAIAAYQAVQEFWRNLGKQKQADNIWQKIMLTPG